MFPVSSYNQIKEMENEEKYIKEKVGQDNPFRVPEGYFEQLTQQVMSQLPKRQQKARQLRFRPWYYAAASIVLLAMMGVSVYFHQDKDEQQQMAVTVETNTENTYIDEVADYAMIDNTEIYACLADN